ncbi:hypothetical protein TVAG_395370 [Trichomonas vaginalis G3]|uniref:Uncharacterized protein n=1 Tax=Trichomonas vaginalis (strain ATCC PRA-98 / G3) TaxID=412133 RepID=A2F1C6_TRIV3|nr:protein of unknown function (DUF4558) family [Trichomonas vaginalis G3]EAY01290.1 hypothetical protein TVAG_395370 [Trichomonas vaginalis G3]KAI5542818.1 protein of unknown function (DUF4558) family [Trichomonas vaginalis G3]|eukprot:XP_001330158.1 hypothetical protein [Trichomonas vaginalis G3]
MSRQSKPSVPANIQALIRANDLHAEAVEQAKINLSKANETKFRESHASFIRNAEVRRNAKLSHQEEVLAHADLICDRRARLAAQFAEDKEEWQKELQARGMTFQKTMI